MSEELKPCPFCSGKSEWCGDDPNGKHTCHIILCRTCGDFDLAHAADPKNITEDIGDLRNKIAVIYNRRATVQDAKDAA
jgi:hypothetical protein